MRFVTPRKIKLSLMSFCVITLALVSITITYAQTQKAKPLTKSHNIKIISNAFDFKRPNPNQNQKEKNKKQETKKLIWHGGLILSSDSPYFGGLSGVIISNKGKDFLAITDKGTWIKATLQHNEKGQIKKISDAKLGPLRKKNGKPLNKKIQADTEAITQTGNQNFLISFEKKHAIKVFSNKNGRPEQHLSSLKLPKETKKMGSNKGLEALDIIKAGPYKNWLITFSEKRESPKGYIVGWLLKGKKFHKIGLKNIDNYQITDLTALPDGRILILERYFNIFKGVKMRIRQISPTNIKSGAKLQGEILLDAPGRIYNIDNMEGISWHKDAQDKEIITLISDDNFNFFQQTMLMQFELVSK